MSNKMIIDVDTGTDDAIALMIALSRSDVEVLAVTCCYGNTVIEQVCRNTMRVLHLCKRLDVPVYKGCAQPFLGDRVISLHHGNDGLGDAGFDDSLDLSIENIEHASNAIVKWVNAYPGEITLVCMAPLTNIAVACQLDPTIGSKLKKCVIMGGNVYAKGRVSPCAEFNFFSDADAAGIVLERLTCSVTQVPYEIAKYQGFRRGNISLSGEFNFRSDPEAANFLLNHLECPISVLAWEPINENMTSTMRWFQALILQDKPKAAFIKAILKTVYYGNPSDPDSDFSCCDPSAMAVAIDSTIVKESMHRYCTVELHGQITRGQMIVDWNGVTQKNPNVEIVMGLNMEKVQTLYEHMIDV